MDINFDKVHWANQKEIYNEPFIRLQMSGDVTRNVLQIGQSKEQVIELLGQPEDTKYFKDFDLVYWLGQEKGFVSIDSSWLVIKFDGTGSVSDFQILND